MFPFCVRAAVVGLALSAGLFPQMCVAADQVAEAAPVARGSALPELGAVPPEPPPGFDTAEEALSAVRSGKVPITNLFRLIPEGVTVRRDVEYGHTGERPLLLDLYLPADLSEPLPAIIFIHGGSWRSGKKEDYRVYGLHFADLGYAVASIQYRLSAEAPFPAAVHDVKAAVRFLKAEAESLGIDPERIGVAGGSAGGHLAMMIGYSSDIPELEGHSGHPGVSSRVQCVVDLYGPADLTTEYVRQVSQTNGAVRAFFEGTYDERPDNYAAGSPVRYITPDDPPTLILHGTVDRVVPIAQSDLLAARLEEAGVPWIFDRLPGWPHGMDLARDVHQRCLWYMERFFARYLKQQAPQSND